MNDHERRMREDAIWLRLLAGRDPESLSCADVLRAIDRMDVQCCRGCHEDELEGEQMCCIPTGSLEPAEVCCAVARAFSEWFDARVKLEELGLCGHIVPAADIGYGGGEVFVDVREPGGIGTSKLYIGCIKRPRGAA